MSSRRVKRIELEAKRKIGRTHNPNRIRKDVYHTLAQRRELESDELEKYERMRVAINDARKGWKNVRITCPLLPEESPTRVDYNTALRFYYTHIYVLRPEIEKVSPLEADTTISPSL